MGTEVVRLAIEAVVTLNGSGAATYILGPVPVWQKWTCSTISIHTAAAIPPAVVINRNSVNGAFIDGTGDTSNNVSTAGPVLLRNESLVFVFTGGSPNAVISIGVEGENERWN